MIDFKLYISVMWVVVWLIWLISAANTKRTLQKESMQNRLLFLVLLGCAATLIYVSRQQFTFLNKEIIPDPEIRGWAGMILTFVSLSFMVWARLNIGRNWSGRVIIKEEHELITSGAYAVTRNPIYTGFLFALTGYAVAAGTVKGFAFVIIAFTAFLIKIKREEIVLSKHFGNAYDDYRRRVKKIIPMIW